MKRRYRLLMLALLLAALAAIYLTNKSFVTGLLMLFQQNSTQSIMGWINKAENPALTVLLLSVFQSFAMPF